MTCNHFNCSVLVSVDVCFHFRDELSLSVRKLRFRNEDKGIMDVHEARAMVTTTTPPGTVTRKRKSSDNDASEVGNRGTIKIDDGPTKLTSKPLPRNRLTWYNNMKAYCTGGYQQLHLFKLS